MVSAGFSWAHGRVIRTVVGPAPVAVAFSPAATAAVGGPPERPTRGPERPR